VLILATAGHVFSHHRRSGDMVRPSVLLLLLLAAQVTLGALTVLTARHYIINSLHVVTGASLLVTSLVLALRAHRSRIGTYASELTDSPSMAAVASRAGARA
jgi:heme A synthase